MRAASSLSSASAARHDQPSRSSAKSSSPKVPYVCLRASRSDRSASRLAGPEFRSRLRHAV
eukprot:6650937-Prymnesium_polylepis.1